MLDARLVLQEVEALLDGHYTSWQQQTPGRVRVYEKPPQQQIAQQNTPGLAKRNGTGQHLVSQKTNPMAPNSSLSAQSIQVREVMTNVFLFLLLTVLSNKLARGRSH